MKYARALVLLLIVLFPSQAWCRIVRVVPNGAGTKDGTSWANGMQYIQTAIDSCSAGDQVWVKAGNYTEHIVLKAGVGTYGGFAGTEAALSERRGFPRSWNNPERSMLDGGVWTTTQNALVRCAANAGPDTILDGFAVFWGEGQLINGKHLGGGIYIYGASPTIRNNYIYGNDADEGGGIYCNNSSAIIDHNYISCNDAASGAGIKCLSSTVKITSNIIEVSNTGGIYLLSCEATISGNVVDSSGEGIRVESSVMARPTYITNNTLLGNNSYSVHCINSNCWVYNNIMWRGGYAVYVEGGTVVGGRNNVSISGTRYYGFTPSPADIYDDVQFYGYERELGHMAAGSPCIDAGYEIPDSVCAKDIDGQPRHNGLIDIGADEFHPTIYVSATGTDLNSGTSWANAKRFVDTAVFSAGGPVWVAKGNYRCNLLFNGALQIYGGFAGTEALLSQRPAFPRSIPDANETVLDGGGVGSVIDLAYNNIARVDGCTVTNGGSLGGSTSGGGMHLYYLGDLAIVNNRITSNSAQSGGGLYVYGAQNSGEISDNTITGNTATYGGGMVVSGAPDYLHILRNTLSGNTGNQSGGGIYGGSGGSTICANTITGNYAPTGAGAYLGSFSGILKNNLVTSNEATGAGGGIACDGGSPTLANNTICRNEATNGGGVSCSGGTKARITSNVIALNTSGVYNSGGSPALSNNCVSRNTGYNYAGVPMGIGDQTADPRFVNESTNNFRLTIYSPCINSGSNGYVEPGDVDKDGRSRIYPTESTVDAGAYEYADARMYTPAEARSIVPDGASIFLATHGPMISIGKLSSQVFYAESADRLSGIQCIGSSPLTLGQTAIIRGVMGTVNGERTLLETTYYGNVIGTAPVPAPWEMISRSIGGGTSGLQKGVYKGVGLNNIGLLVRTTGRVFKSDTSGFFIDDGGGSSAIYVYGASGVYRPHDGEYVAVTGISSTESDGKFLLKVIRTRQAGDVVRLQ